jgi:formamidopyrimidine-DNA glycosylase
MSEGPQVKRRTEWLQRHMVGQKVLTATSAKSDLGFEIAEFSGHHVTSVACKGKNIYIAFDNDLVMHNHMLMQGTWRRYECQLLFNAPDTWLALYLGPHTVCNHSGQRIAMMTTTEALQHQVELGPDVMSYPYPSEEIEHALGASDLPIAEALLKQSVISGLGNVARAETLFLAKIDPRTPASDLRSGRMNALHTAMRKVMWDSYREGGRWIHRVYRNSGRPCQKCSKTICKLQLKPSRRSVYFCPHCQA